MAPCVTADVMMMTSVAKKATMEDQDGCACEVCCDCLSNLLRVCLFISKVNVVG